MRTPAVMIIGMVLAPCGLVLNLTSTVAPDWRTLGSVPLHPTDYTVHQGLWDICSEQVTNQNKQCGLDGSTYFPLQVVQVARGLMISSLVVTALSIALASWGVRCWEDIPNNLISACSGIVMFISGVLSLIAVSWYNNQMYHLLETDQTSGLQINVGYCLVLGYLGSCFEIIGGASLMLCFVPVFQEWLKNHKKTSSSIYYSKKQTPNKNSNPSQVYSIKSDYNQDRYSSDMRYSIHNDNYQPDTRSRGAPSDVSYPRSYTNPMDVTSGEHPRSPHRPGSQLSSLPCDSDLL
ncbi:claudin-23 [Gastrophryne carolinensis]